MTPNVEAMLRTIQTFLRLATPEERIEFASVLYKETTNAEAFVCTAGDSGVVLDLRGAAAGRDDTSAT